MVCSLVRWGHVVVGKSMRRVWSTLGGLTLFLVFFFGTLVLVDYVLPSWRNGTRAEDVKTIKRGLAAYFKKHGSYPERDTRAEGLKVFLVDERFLNEIPLDPLHPNPQYRYHYVSDGKTYYGLLVWFEPTTAPWGSTSQSVCLTGIGTETAHGFGEPPPHSCPF
jgi:hypothetical protein